MPVSSTLMQAAQTLDEARAFMEAFAKVRVCFIRDTLGAPIAEAAQAESSLHPDWDNPERLIESGLTPEKIDADVRAGKKYLHIDVAAAKEGRRARDLFLGLSGLSEKQQRSLFPALRARSAVDRTRLSEEVCRLNAWLEDVRTERFDPEDFVKYQRSIGIHGQTQNLVGSIGAAGAAIAFVDAIRELSPHAISDSVGELAPPDVRSPAKIYEWQRAQRGRTVKALLLENGRALVFASSKDANIFQPLGAAFDDAADALKRFNSVAKDQRKRAQELHEFAVGEVKTATDLANLHERMGLASRETQTELRTDRFLMMAVLNPEILSGGTQRRVMNNRDLTRFSHVFNLHHCWGWDGGRARNPEHWATFKACVAEWCGL